MTPLFSIVIPAFNAQATIERCLNSILADNDMPVQVIIVDDGSVDATLRICREKALHDTRLLVASQTNSGTGAARQHGLGLATGGYISFVDADDYVEPDTYRLLQLELRESEFEIVEFGYDFVYENGEATKPFVLKPQTLDQPLLLKNYICHINTTNYLCNKVFKRELFDGIRHVHLSAGEDAYLLTQLHMKASRKKTIAPILYHYVQTSQSLCRAPFNKKKLDTITADQKILELLESVGVDLYQQYAYTAAAHCALLYSEMSASSLAGEKQTLGELHKLFSTYYQISKKLPRKELLASRKRRISVMLFAVSPVLHGWVYLRI